MDCLRISFVTHFIVLLLCFVNEGRAQEIVPSSKLLEFVHGDTIERDTLIQGAENRIQITSDSFSQAHSQSLFIVCTNPLLRAITLYKEDGTSLPPLRTISGGKVWLIDATTQALHFEFGATQYDRVPILLMTPKAFLKYRLHHTLFLGVYIGIILLVIFVSLSIYWYNKETDFRNFSVMCLGVGLAQLSVNGFGQAEIETLWPMHECFLVTTFANLSLFGSLLFIWYFLKLQQEEKIQGLLICLFVVIGLVSLALNFLSFYGQAYLVLIWNNLFAAIWITIVTIKAKQGGHKGAGIFLLAWSFFCTGIILFILKDIGVLPWSWLTQNSMTIGSGIECIFIGIAISYRIRGVELQKNRFHKEKEIAHLTNIQLQEENEKLNILMNDMRQRMFLLQLKPHYFANSLNNINSLIIRRKNKKASKYLVSFGRMMRQMIQEPKDDYILLFQECISINAYLMMENFRLQKSIDFQIKCSPKLNMKSLIVPNMLLQPLIENAIIHGLQALTNRKPILRLEFTQFDSYLEVKVDDNGIGRQIKKKQEYSFMSVDEKRTSMGTKLIQERLAIICSGMNFVPFHIIDKIDDRGKPCGVTAIVRMPYKTNNLALSQGLETPFKSEWLVHEGQFPSTQPK